MPNALQLDSLIKSSSLSTITSGEVLAIDISAIVGVLIFLTIGGVEFRSSDINMPNIVSLISLEENSEAVNQNDNNNVHLIIGLLNASIVYPFAISAIVALFKINEHTDFINLRNGLR